MISEALAPRRVELRSLMIGNTVIAGGTLTYLCHTALACHYHLQVMLILHVCGCRTQGNDEMYNTAAKVLYLSEPSPVHVTIEMKI